MNFSKYSDCSSIFHYYCASTRMECACFSECVRIAGSYIFKILYAERIKQGINNSLQFIIICTAAVHADGQPVGFKRKLIRTCRNIFLAYFKKPCLFISVIVIPRENFKHRWNSCCSHNACIFTERIGYFFNISENAVIRKFNSIKMFW